MRWTAISIQSELIDAYVLLARRNGRLEELDTFIGRCLGRGWRDGTTGRRVALLHSARDSYVSGLVSFAIGFARFGHDQR